MRYRPQLPPPMGIFCVQRWCWNQFAWPDWKLVGLRLNCNNKNNVNSFYPLFENKSSVPSHTFFIVIAVAHELLIESRSGWLRGQRRFNKCHLFVKCISPQGGFLIAVCAEFGYKDAGKFKAAENYFNSHTGTPKNTYSPWRFGNTDVANPEAWLTSTKNYVITG